jgi:poly(3-hydroxybutyrate) depolymerase
MVTDTVALAAALAAALASAAFVAAAFVAVAFAAVAFTAVADPYNPPVYQGSAGYTDQLVEQFSFV